jgi:membrane peptidoglycan carboxypeptidase
LIYMDGHRKGRRRWRLVRRTLYGIGVVIICLCTAVAVMYTRTEVPPVNAAARAQASTFSYRDGTTLAQVGRLNRVPVRLRDVPAHVRGAVLAAEDRGFYHDPVVSPSGLARAGWAAMSGGPRQGGSGIAQQYVKIAYLSPEQTVSRKMKELLIAVKLSRSRSKDWIFEQYLNTVYFGRGAYGVQAAAQAYFRKNVGALTPAEGALLAAVIQAPSYLDPALGHTARTRARWRYVIDGMTATGVLPKGPPPAFPRVAAAHAEPVYAGQRGYLIERVIGELHDHGFDDDQIYRRGLRVTTTIDAAMQAALPAAVRRGVGADKDLAAGVVAVRPGTGEVLAAYGGRDYLKRPYDNAFVAALPPGSSFHPFLLTTALRSGIGLGTRLDASPVRQVVNDDDIRVDSADLLTATVRSYRTVFARLAAKTGAAGAAPAGLPTRLPPERVRVVDQAAAYATLADGKYAAPHVLAKVADGSGKVLLDLRPRTRRAFSPEVAAGVTFALRNEVERGVGRRAALADRPAAGQIGTTEHNAAAWFCGYTPDIAAAVVVYRPSNRPLINEGNAPHRRATDVPAEIWRSFMTSAESGRPVRWFRPLAPAAAAKDLFLSRSRPEPSSPTPRPSATPRPASDPKPSAKSTRQPPSGASPMPGKLAPTSSRESKTNEPGRPRR